MEVRTMGVGRESKEKWQKKCIKEDREKEVQSPSICKDVRLRQRGKIVGKEGSIIHEAGGERKKNRSLISTTRTGSIQDSRAFGG